MALQRLEFKSRIMNKNGFLITLVLVLGLVYVYYFTGLFTKFSIHIDPRPRPLARGAKAAVYPVAFALDQRYLLTSVKVVPLVSNTFNRFTPAVLHLVSKSNSIPVSGFIYGDPIKGMEPADPKVKTGTLQPNVVYRLFLEAKGRKGQVDFRAPLVPRIDN